MFLLVSIFFCFSSIFRAEILPQVNHVFIKVNIENHSEIEHHIISDVKNLFVFNVQNQPPTTDKDQIKAQTGFKQIIDFTEAMKTFLSLLGGTIFFIGVIVAAMLRMMAFGSDKRVAQSNQALIAAIVGLAILGMGNAISTLFTTYFK